MKPWEFALVAAVLYLLLRERRAPASTLPSEAFPLEPRAPRAGGESPAVRTGGNDETLWYATRYAATVDDLVRRGVDPTAALRGARALVAQWAVETNAGKSEYNFNLGGWVAARGEPFHVVRDATSGREIRWASFPSLDESIHEHIDRLQRPRFREAFVMLARSPLSDAWVRELGRAGYYEADPDKYASAWRHRLQEVAELTNVEA